MTAADRLLKPAPWVCFRTWVAADGERRSMVSNEKDHHLAVLDGPSSELWAAIERGCTLGTLNQHAERLDAASELDDFISILDAQGFLAGRDDEGQRASPAPPPHQIESAQNANVEHDMMRWVADKGYLFGVHWEVTYRCNERCVHCYNPGAAHNPHEKPERETDELSPAEALTLLDDLRYAGVFRLTLSGGEVMLRRDFWELVAAARAQGFSVNIYTNGLKLDEEACRKLAALWPTSVSISVYSAEADAHDAITGVPGSFRRSVQALEGLQALGVKTYLKSTQMGHTLTGYKKVRKLADRLGAGAELDMIMSASVDGATAPLQLAADNPEELVVLAATPGSPLYVGTAESNWGFVHKDKNASVCGAAIGSLGIDPTGGINACNSMPIPAGSHRTHGFLQVWRASRQYRLAHATPEPPPSLEAAVSLLSHWQTIQLKDFHECGTHRRCGWCTKCPGTAMLEHGDPLAPSTTNCRLATARMTAADLLAQGLTREAIAERLGVTQDFGHRPAKRIPIIVETQRGTGFDPAQVACGVLSCGSSSPLTSASLRDKSGNVLLARGAPATAAAISAFEGVTERIGVP